MSILYIVATPMGNLEDITLRAIRVLKEADLIAAEDTRHSKRLLNHYGITTPMVSCHEHNEIQKTQELIARLKAGKIIALISDAGTPLISDPGYRLVLGVAQENIPVVPIPGCNAGIAGLSASGLPTDSFLFCGFPPKKQAQQSKILTQLKSQPATLIFYESPKRIKTLVQRSLQVFGDRRACVAREITKRHEEFIRGSLSDIFKDLDSRDQIKGECVLFIHGAMESKTEISTEELDALIKARLTPDTKTGTLAKDLSISLNLPKKLIYDAILALKKG